MDRRRWRFSSERGDRRLPWRRRWRAGVTGGRGRPRRLWRFGTAGGVGRAHARRLGCRRREWPGRRAHHQQHDLHQQTGGGAVRRRRGAWLWSVPACRHPPPADTLFSKPDWGGRGGNGATASSTQAATSASSWRRGRSRRLRRSAHRPATSERWPSMSGGRGWNGGRSYYGSSNSDGLGGSGGIGIALTDNAAITITHDGQGGAAAGPQIRSATPEPELPETGRRNQRIDIWPELTLGATAVVKGGSF